MIDVRIQILFNILRMNGQHLTKYCIHIIIDKIYVGIVNRHFSQICNSCGPSLTSEFSFFNIERTKRLIETKFCIHIIIDKIYIGIVNNLFFRKFETELWPLIDVRIQFLFNILRTNRRIEAKFCIHIIIDKIYVGIVNHYFCPLIALWRGY